MLHSEDIDGFKNLVVENDFDTLFQALFKVVRQLSPLLENNLLIMHGDYRRMTNDYQTQTISRDEYDLEANKLSRSLLYFIDQLPVAQPQSTDPAGKKRYPSGKVLYDIPRRLPLQKVTKCVVRIGETEDIVLENFTPSPDVKIENVRIAKVMEVELLDANEGRNFKITTLNSKDQKIYSDDYSEWFFFVTPLLAGQHDLYLKVSVLQIVDGKERAKEIVFERAVEVVSEAVEARPPQWEDTKVRIAGQQTDKTRLEDFPSTSIDLEEYLKGKGTHFSVEESASGYSPSDWDGYTKGSPLEDKGRQNADSESSSGSDKPEDWAGMEPPSMEISEPEASAPPPPPNPFPSRGPASAPPPPPKPSAKPSKSSPAGGGLSSQPFPKPSLSSQAPKKEGGGSTTLSVPSREGFRWTSMANLLVIAVATFLVAYYAATYTNSSTTTEGIGKGDSDVPADSLQLDTTEKEDSLRLELKEKE